MKKRFTEEQIIGLPGQFSVRITPKKRSIFGARQHRKRSMKKLKKQARMKLMIKLVQILCFLGRAAVVFCAGLSGPLSRTDRN